MQQLIGENKDIFDLLVQILIIVIPAILTWLVRNYVKSAESEKALAAIVQLANAAIDFVEDLDSRGDLDDYLRRWNFPPEIIEHTSQGIKKLNAAGNWTEGELKKMGIKMTPEEAQSWVAAEFQKRVGDVALTRTIARTTREAVDLVQVLTREGLIQYPDNVDDLTYLADKIADWVMRQTSTEQKDDLRAEAIARVRSELPQLHPPASKRDAPELSTTDTLASLAKQAVNYVLQLKQTHELSLPEVDIAVAWMLTEVTKRRLSVTPEQISGAVRSAFAGVS